MDNTQDSTMQVMDEEATQLTQGVIDPRRTGDMTAMLDSKDVADIICVLLPASPAAYKVAANTAALAPQHILATTDEDHSALIADSQNPDNESTFILPKTGNHHASHNLELALRFSSASTTKTPGAGFFFGRTKSRCDFALDADDTLRKISGIHFRIYFNDSGVLMLQDLSQNGTVVDDQLLRGKMHKKPQTRMLISGSVIVISPTGHGEDGMIKFIVRIPSRSGCEALYMDNVKHYLEFSAREVNRHRLARPVRQMVEMVPSASTAPGRPARLLAVQQPLAMQNFGMRWNGDPHYNVSGTLGKGAFATVFLLTTKVDGHYFAAKELDKSKCVRNGILDRRIQNELDIMKELKHDNIVQFVDYHNHDTHLYIIMEHVGGGDLQGYINRNHHLAEPVAKLMAAQILDALTYLHHRSVTHRDIKPDNILIADQDTDKFWVKLSDFGLSKVVTNDETFLKTFCGTLLYCAPEVFPHYQPIAQRKRDRSGPHPRYHSYSKSVDVWSFGAVLWYSLCGEVPFEGIADHNGHGMFSQIMTKSLSPGPLLTAGNSPIAWDLLSSMLRTDPATRLTAAQCRQHCWFSELPPSTDSMTAGDADAALSPIGEEAEPVASAGVGLSELSIRDVTDSSDDKEHEDMESKRFKQWHASNEESTGDKMSLDTERVHESPQPESIHLRPTSVDEPAASPESDGNLSIRELSDDDYNGPVIKPDASADHIEPDTASLGGAEAMVQALHVDSPQSSVSAHGESDCPSSPKTPPQALHESARSDDPDITPKAAPFSRRIAVNLPASCFFDPMDPSTHNAEYASVQSGHDFQAHPTLLSSSFGPALGQAGALRQIAANGQTQLPATSPATHDFARPAPRLGRLISTDGSFADIAIMLSGPLTTWGRGPINIVVYPSANDSRVPKRGVLINFNAANMTKALNAQEDWTKLPDLHCNIATEATSGIHVNGVRLLAKDHKGRRLFGRLHTGDLITICPSRQPPNRDRVPGLDFKVEIYHGLGKERRQQDFKVEREHLGPLGNDR